MSAAPPLKICGEKSKTKRNDLKIEVVDLEVIVMDELGIEPRTFRMR